MRETPWVRTPSRSPRTRMRAQSSASAAGTPHLSSARAASARSAASAIRPTGSFRCDLRLADHASPFLRLRADIARELLARARMRLETVLEHFRLHRRLAQHLPEFLVPTLRQ